MKRVEKGEIIGKGREAEVIYWGNNRVLKLFYKNIPNDLINYQFKVDSLIGNVYPNCPKAIEKIVENDRIGVIYEYIEGIILNEIFKKNLRKIGKNLRTLAEMHVNMHKHEIREIDVQRGVYKQAIQRSELLNDNQKEEIIEYLEKLPDGNILCHGDFHPDNILVSKDKWYVIDWGNAYSGNPNGDVARTYYLLKYGLGPSDEDYVKKSYFHRLVFKILKVFKSRFAKIYLNYYLKLTTKTQKDIEKWNLVIFATRLCEGVPLENDKLLKLIKKLLKNDK